MDQVKGQGSLSPPPEYREHDDGQPVHSGQATHSAQQVPNGRLDRAAKCTQSTASTRSTLSTASTASTPSTPSSLATPLINHRTALAGRVTVALTHSPLDISATLALVKDPSAGAVVMFAGTTRATSKPEGVHIPSSSNNTDETGPANTAGHAFTIKQGTDSPLAPEEDGDRSTKPQEQGYLPVSGLTYHSYEPLALRTLVSIGQSVLEAHGLCKLAIVHRLSTVPVGEESVLVCVSAAHRRAAWKGGEEALEEVKKRAEVWKWEEFVDAGQGAGWRSNDVDGMVYGQR